jgi:hypothetical protein
MATEKEVSPRDIVMIDAKESGENWEHEYGAMVHMTGKDRRFRVMRHNNTLFAYYRKDKTTLSLKIKTADEEKAFVEAVVDFKKAAKIAKFKQAYSEIHNPKVLDMLGKNMDALGIEFFSTNNKMKNKDTMLIAGIRF